VDCAKISVSIKWTLARAKLERKYASPQGFGIFHDRKMNALQQSVNETS
jgi:hypothetical protein